MIKNVLDFDSIFFNVEFNFSDFQEENTDMTVPLQTIKTLLEEIYPNNVEIVTIS